MSDTVTIYENVIAPEGQKRFGTAQTGEQIKAERDALHRLKQQLIVFKREDFFDKSELEMIVIQTDPSKQVGMGVGEDLGGWIHRWKVEVPVDL